MDECPCTVFYGFKEPKMTDNQMEYFAKMMTEMPYNIFVDYIIDGAHKILNWIAVLN